MRFEVFDRDAAAQTAPDGPLVSVDRVGRLLFNGAAWELLAVQSRPDLVGEVTLGFDVETRTVAVQPVVTQDVPAGARWKVAVMRSVAWPRGVNAKAFVDHYQLGSGEYSARRGPGPQMVTFDVGAPRRLPVGVPTGSVAEEA